MPKRQKETMRIWDQVSTTDPDHTKEVSFGRKFTAIDAHSQVMEATRAFGPIGEGWGYEVRYDTLQLADSETLVFADLTFWWSAKDLWEGNKLAGGRHSFGPVRGCSILQKLDSKGKLRTDTDATKKAMTDALTKCLSHLGFNADVFLGMFDDNKYVEGLRKDKAKEADAAAAAYQEKRAKFIEVIKECDGDHNKIDAAIKEWGEWMKTLAPGTATEMVAWAMRQKLVEGGKSDGPE